MLIFLLTNTFIFIDSYCITSSSIDQSLYRTSIFMASLFFSSYIIKYEPLLTENILQLYGIILPPIAIIMIILMIVIPFVIKLFEELIFLLHRIVFSFREMFFALISTIQSIFFNLLELVSKFVFILRNSFVFPFKLLRKTLYYDYKTKIRQAAVIYFT